MSDKKSLGKFSFKPKQPRQSTKDEAERLINDVAQEVFSDKGPRSNKRRKRSDHSDRDRLDKKDREERNDKEKRKNREEKLYFRDPYPSIHREKVSYKRYIDTILGSHLVIKKSQHDDTVEVQDVVETRPRWSKFIYSTPMVLRTVLPSDTPPSLTDQDDEAPRIENMRRRRAQLNAVTKHDPRNVEAWYRLALLERDLFILEHDTAPTSTVIVDVIQSMFKTAAQKSEHPQLVREYVRLVTEKSEKVKIALEFAVNHPCSELWELVFDCCIDDWSTSFSALEIEDKWFKSGYMDKLWKLADSHSIALSVIYRLTKFLREAGYVERAIGIYQGLIELNLFLPDSLKNIPLERVLYAMQQYWDMETRRFGDTAAAKWKKTDPEDQPPDYDAQTITSIDDEFTGILFPCRSIHKFALQDPDSVVLFDDIRLYLFQLSRANISQLLFSFMSLLGVSTPEFFDVDTPVHQADPQTVVEIIRQLTHTSEELPDEFVSWTLEFIAANDSEFFKKYSRHMLNRPYLRQNLLLYQKVAALDSTFASVIYDTIGSFYEFADADTSLTAWMNWATVDITNSLKHRATLLKVYGSLALEQASGDLITGVAFIYRCLTGIDEEIAQWNLNLSSALKDFWAHEPSFGYPDMFILVENILAKHLSLRHSSIVPVQFHYRRLSELVEILYYTNQPSTKNLFHLSQILSNIAKFQLKYNWRLMVPLLRLPMCDYYPLRVLLFQYRSAIVRQTVDLKREVYMESLLGEEDNAGRTLMYSVLTSSSVWLDYFHYELSIARTTGDYFTTKLVYLQALRHCGWSKDVLLAGLNSLSDKILPRKERLEILQAAFQRELHFRLDISSLLEDYN